MFFQSMDVGISETFFDQNIGSSISQKVDLLEVSKKK